eukprot:1189103-Prorocentrum_minimum.AAC.2
MSYPLTRRSGQEADTAVPDRAAGLRPCSASVPPVHHGARSESAPMGAPAAPGPLTRKMKQTTTKGSRR